MLCTTQIGLLPRKIEIKFIFNQFNSNLLSIIEYFHIGFETLQTKDSFNAHDDWITFQQTVPFKLGIIDWAHLSKDSFAFIKYQRVINNLSNEFNQFF